MKSEDTEYKHVVFFGKISLMPKKKSNLYQRSYVTKRNGRDVIIHELRRGKKGKVINRSVNIMPFEYKDRQDKHLKQKLR